MPKIKDEKVRQMKFHSRTAANGKFKTAQQQDADRAADKHKGPK